MGYKTVEVREIAIQHRVNGAAIAAAVVVLREILGLAACLWEQQLKFNPYLCFHCWLRNERTKRGFSSEQSKEYLSIWPKSLKRYWRDMAQRQL